MAFLALDAEGVAELLGTAKREETVGDRAKLKALIRASGSQAVPVTPRAPVEGVASLRARFDTPPQQLRIAPPIPAPARAGPSPHLLPHPRRRLCRATQPQPQPVHDERRGAAGFCY